MEISYDMLARWLTKIEKTHDLLFDMDKTSGYGFTPSEEKINNCLYEVGEVLEQLAYQCDNASNEEKHIHATKYGKTSVTIATVKTTLKIDPQSKMLFLTPELSKENIITLAQVAFDYANERGLEGNTVRNLQYKYDDVGTELTVECIRMD
jgi:hypothetical protein